VAFPFPGAGFLELEASVIIETKFRSIEELVSFAWFLRRGFGATLIIERRNLAFVWKHGESAAGRAVDEGVANGSGGRGSGLPRLELAGICVTAPQPPLVP